MNKTIPKLNDEELILGIRASEEGAFHELYQRYQAMITGYICKNSGTLEDAREIIQLTMVKFFLAVRDGRYEHQAKMGHYIYQLAVNSWREELRRRRTRPTDDLSENAYKLSDESAEALAEAVVKDKQLNALHRALSQLGQPCQDLIRNYHLKQVQLKEIAVQLQYDYNNLRKRLFDCRRKLKQLTELLLVKQ